jgi:hypothetical protein
MKASAAINTALKPERSQVFVIALAVAMMICFGVSFYFMWLGQPLWWVPFISAWIFTFLACGAWFLSHKNVDLHGATPTTVAITPDGGISLTADPRLLFSEQGKVAVADIIHAVTYRQPLPAPAGIVDESGVPIPDSATEAAHAVDAINAEVTRAKNEVFGCPSLQGSQALSEQPRLEMPLPPGGMPTAANDQGAA